MPSTASGGLQGLRQGHARHDALGYVEALASFSWLAADGWSENGGGPAVLGHEATRFRPAGRLMALAEDMGVRASRVLAHFRATPPTEPVAEADLVQVRTLAALVPRPGMRPLKLRGERLEKIKVADDLQRLHLAWLRRKVADTNSFADRHRITHGPAPGRPVVAPRGSGGSVEANTRAEERRRRA